MTLDLTVMRPAERGLNIGYSTFAEYRRLLARDACGIDLDTMQGFGGDKAWPPHDTVPLRHLLQHSDVDGWLYKWECDELAPVLRVFQPPQTWPTWARDLHEALVRLVLDVADNGGLIRFH